CTPFTVKVVGFDRASDFSRDYDGACLQMRMSYSPAAQFFLFLVQWTDCSLAGALGLLRILIYKVACMRAWCEFRIQVCILSVTFF
ncbi:Os04g0679800, partial [Oryza sativa Japonica Group]